MGFVKHGVPQGGTKELAYRLNGATLKPFLALTPGLSRCFRLPAQFGHDGRHLLARFCDRDPRLRSLVLPSAVAGRLRGNAMDLIPQTEIWVQMVNFWLVPCKARQLHQLPQ